MAFAAATCLKRTTERLLNYPQYISLVPPSTETIQAVHTEVESLISLLKKLDMASRSRSRERVNALDGEIREVVSKFEDVLESHVTDQMLSQSDRMRGNGDGRTRFSIDLMDLEQDIHSFTQRVTELKTVYTRIIYTMFGKEDDGVVSSVTGFAGTVSEMVGLSDQFHKIKSWVVDPEALSQGWEAFRGSLYGMGGIGKTTLAKKIFDDPDVKTLYYPRLWVTLGRKCSKKDILRVLISQLNPSDDHILEQWDEDMAVYLKERLEGRRFLLVVDDVWDLDDCHEVVIWLVPDELNGSRLLLTSRIFGEVSKFRPCIGVRLLDKEESWELLCREVFGKESCPPRLVKAGKKIAEECDGLPLTIVTIARLLSRAEMTPEYWDEVAKDRNSVFTQVYEEISEVLYPSYDYLPQHLKMCFLSAGVFPKKTVIPRSKLVNMWGVEEFLVGEYSDDYVVALVDHSLFIQFETSSTLSFRHEFKMKACGVHSASWYLCKREAGKTKSFHVLSNYEHGLSEDMKRQRRLCIHNSVLFAIKDVYNSMEDEHCSSTARSLGCYGPYHPYQVPMTFGLKLLSLLDALLIRFYEFPNQVQRLVQLRYLALTYGGMLPASISKLWNLQFLIVRHHLRIFRSSQFLPIEIWDMKEVKHIQVMGSDLPDPTPVDTFLPNLSTLLDVTGKTCTEGVLLRTPNLNRLGVRIEMRPDGNEPFSWLAHLSCLEKLEILKCVVVNPVHRPEVAPLPNFPLSIVKLTLSGLCYPWEEMSKIAKMPCLEVLKLRNYAFQGPEWHIEEHSFQSLRYLLIEDTDLEQWKVGSVNFSYMFACIVLKDCYKLEKIHWELVVETSPWHIRSLLPILKVVDCNPSIIPCWNKILEKFENKPRVIAHSSWVDKKLDSRLVHNFE